jgi:tol-pal system protein YbgF
MFVIQIKKILSGTCSLICALCSVLIISGCASTEDTGRLQWDINELRTEVNNIKKTTKSTARLEKINKQLDDLEEAQKSTGQTLSDLMIQVQTLSSEFQVLTGRFEESRYFSEKSSSELIESKDQLLAKMKDIEFELAEIKKKRDQARVLAEQAKKEEAERAAQLKKAEEAKKAQKIVVKRVKKPVAKKEESNSAVKDTYMTAYQDFKEGNIADAREKFQSVLNDFPENDYSDNARFWIGETYYKEGQFEDAILAYQELFDKNPKSDKVPGAMLKQGLAFYALKDQKTGKIILERLIEKYPDTEQAKMAVRKMKKPSVPPKNIKK